MTKNSKKIPKFKSEKEEAEFWAKHSPLEYPDKFTEVKQPFEFDPELARKVANERKERKRSVTFRIEPSKIDLVKIIAKRHGSAYQSLIRIWINEKINEEFEDDSTMRIKLHKRKTTS